MIFYNEELYLSLREYGITIPLLNERFKKIQAFLLENKPDVLIGKTFEPISDDHLLLTYSQDFLNHLKSDPTHEVMKTFELVKPDGSYHRFQPETAIRPLEDLVDTVRKQVSATLEASRYALENGFAFFLGGGLHHAMSTGGRGFCLLNDMVVASNVLLEEKLLKKIWIIDVDAHKGCGTAELCRNHPSVITMSIHMKKGWPLDGPSQDENGQLNPWFIPSDIDIAIDKGEEDFYMVRLKETLLDISESLGTPDLVFIVQGADPYEHDELESSNLLNLTLEQMKERDQFVYDFFKSKGIPQCYVMGGGYGVRAHEPTIEFFKTIFHLEEKN